MNLYISLNTDLHNSIMRFKSVSTSAFVNIFPLIYRNCGILKSKMIQRNIVIVHHLYRRYFQYYFFIFIYPLFKNFVESRITSGWQRSPNIRLTKLGGLSLITELIFSMFSNIISRVVCVISREIIPPVIIHISTRTYIKHFI
jgi:hypothetical protein